MWSDNLGINRYEYQINEYIHNCTRTCTCLCGVEANCATKSNGNLAKHIKSALYQKERGELRQSKRWVGDREQLGLRYFHVFEKAAEVSLFLSNMHRKGRVYMVPFSEKKP